MGVFKMTKLLIGQIFTVCDGMGGHVGGAIASKIAVSSILEYLMKVDLASPSVEINNAIVFANQQILEHLISNPSMKGMGTTCTVMVVKHDSIHIGHVGDSRIYIFTNNELIEIKNSNEIEITQYNNFFGKKINNYVWKNKINFVY